MGTEKQATKCPWCGAVLAPAEVKVSSANLGAGAVKQRHCPKCGKILAAYLESEGSFLPKIRTF